jgi:hypothetical protein
LKLQKYLPARRCMEEWYEKGCLRIIFLVLL